MVASHNVDVYMVASHNVEIIHYIFHYIYLEEAFVKNKKKIVKLYPPHVHYLGSIRGSVSGGSRDKLICSNT